VLSPGGRTRPSRRLRATAATAAVVVATGAALAGCGGGSSRGSGAAASAGAIKLRSAAFAPGAAIPVRFTCDGADVSPPLSWSRLPANTAELALTLEDLDAPGRPFTHWALAGLSGSSNGLAIGALPSGAVQGRNDFGRLGYGGPCPPRRARHRYEFVLYALRAPLSIASGFRLADSGTALAKDTLAFGALLGTYRR
jgi:Raf kinase inhibitor-like YbhB/YbcL family protein